MQRGAISRYRIFYDRVANALQIPPALLKGDIADVAALTRNLITFGIDPFARAIETENNRKLYGTQVLDGSYQMIDTSTIMHMTAAELAAASDKMISCGGWSIDEIRRKAGDAPLNTEWSGEHFLTKNYSEVETLKDGKGGADPQPGGEDTDDSGKGGEDEGTAQDQVPV